MLFSALLAASAVESALRSWIPASVYKVDICSGRCPWEKRSGEREGWSDISAAGLKLVLCSRLVSA